MFLVYFRRKWKKNFADFLKKGPTKNFHFTFSSIPRQVTKRLCNPFSCIVSNTWNFFSLPVTYNHFLGKCLNKINNKNSNAVWDLYHDMINLVTEIRLYKPNLFLCLPNCAMHYIICKNGQPPLWIFHHIHVKTYIIVVTKFCQDNIIYLITFVYFKAKYFFN